MVEDDSEVSSSRYDIWPIVCGRDNGDMTAERPLICAVEDVVVEKPWGNGRSLGLGLRCIPPVGRNESDENLDIVSMIG